jgi:DNA-binding transcriptional LysR family regulator
VDQDSRIRRRLKLRHLDILLAVARHRSMAQAAVELSISQPAVSKAIAEMEQTLGVRLLDRTAQGVEPNVYGYALLKWAVAVFDDVRQGVKEIEFLADPAAGEVRIGASEPIIAGLLPAIIERVHRDYPRISIHVKHVLTSGQQARDLRERSIDLVLGRMATQYDDDIEAEILFHERTFVVAGAKNQLTGRRSIRLAELMKEPWLLPPPDTVIGSLVAGAFRVSGLDLPRASVGATSMQLYSALMVAGPYLAILPTSILHFSAKRLSLKVVAVNLPIAPWPVGVVRLKNRIISPVAQVFIDCAREVARTLEGANIRR